MLNVIFIVHFSEFLENDELVDGRMDLLTSLGFELGKTQLVLLELFNHVGEAFVGLS